MESQEPSAVEANPLLWWGIAALISSLATFLSLHVLGRLPSIADDPVASALSKVLWVSGLTTPITVGLKGLLLGGIIWAIIELQGMRATYGRCMEAVWVGELALATGTYFQALVGLSRGPNSIQDLAVPLGIDLFWQPSSGVAAILIQSVSLPLLGWAILAFIALADKREDGPTHRAQGVSIVAAACVLVGLPLLTLPW